LRKRVIYGILAVVAVGLVVLAARPKPLDVQTARVTRGPMRVTADDDGKTRVRERYMVAAPVSGTLSRVELHAGDAVEPGTVIARLLPLPSPLLDPRAREVAVEELASARNSDQKAQAAIARAEAAADLARSSLERDRRLAAQGTLGASDLEKTEANARMAESDLESARFAKQVAAHAAAQAQAALARFDLKPGAADHFDITSVHGRILRVLHADGGPVTAGTAIVEVGDLASLEIVVELLSQDAVAVRPAMPATLTRWGGPKPLAARVRRVEPAGFTKVSALGVEEQRVNVLLDLDDPPAAAQLGDGFAVDVSILTWSGENVLQAPTSALFRQGDRWGAFVVNGGRAVLRPVQVGHLGPLSAEIQSGLADGDVVVAHPPASLASGAKVRGTGEGS